MRIYVYSENSEFSHLPIECVWLWEDYPDGILTNTQVPNQTLRDYEIWFDRVNGFPPRHPDGEERNFTEYIHNFSGEDHKRIKFEKMYRLFYYETDDLAEFMISHPDLKIEYHRDHFFVRTWYE